MLLSSICAMVENGDHRFKPHSSQEADIQFSLRVPSVLSDFILIVSWCVFI